VTSVLAGKIGWALMVTVWYAIRYPYERRSKRASVGTSAKDLSERLRMTVSLTGLGVVPLIYLWTNLFDFADRSASWPVVAVGAVIACGALALFVLTHKALGKLWSVSLELKQEHQLVTHGVYQTLRHPMYSAFWLMALAQAFFLANWISGFSGLLGFGCLFFLRIGPEEKMMEAAFGDQYRDYQTRSWRVIPYVW
jgi:protein-S-isoprenylcysteine O-methyltransferase Ste14